MPRNARLHGHKPEGNGEAPQLKIEMTRADNFESMGSVEILSFVIIVQNMEADGSMRVQPLQKLVQESAANRLSLSPRVHIERRQLIQTRDDRPVSEKGLAWVMARVGAVCSGDEHKNVVVLRKHGSISLAYLRRGETIDLLQFLECNVLFRVRISRLPRLAAEPAQGEHVRRTGSPNVEPDIKPGVNPGHGGVHGHGGVLFS